MSKKTELKKNRLAFLYLMMMVAFLIVIIRLFYVVTMGDRIKVRNSYNSNSISYRASIVDRNNVILATDLHTKSLYVSSILVRDPKRIASDLIKIFPELDHNDILKKIVTASKNKSIRNWVLLRRNLTPSQVEKVQDLKHAGLLFQDDKIRVYPQKSINSHLVGYVDLDRHGLSGVEMQYDKRLMSDREPLKLAVDVRIQDVLYDELQKAMTEFNSEAAAGVVMDVTNGEILGMISLPNFDSNIQSEATPNQRFNRITNGIYELGSVCKIFTNTILFEDDLVKMDEIFNVRDPIKYGSFTINDHDHIKDQMTVEEIFRHSSNIGTVEMAKRIGPKRQKEFFKEVGLLDKLEIDFPGLGKPIYPKSWSDISLYTISYGHGLAMTPLHLAAVVSGIVNEGVMHKPSFLKLKETPQGKVIVKPNTSQQIKYLLRKTALEGTGVKANIVGYEVCGKTGTAERRESGKYSKKQNLASFVAVFPISRPKYLIYVLFDRPSYLFNTGGMVAAPVAGRVIKNIAPILDFVPIFEEKEQTKM